MSTPPATITVINTRVGRVASVTWTDGDQTINLTPCFVTKVKREITVGNVPVVEVSFLARLVETIEQGNH